MDDASVGVQENLSAEGTLPSKEKVWSVVTEMCRKNGITHNYNCAQKLCKSVEGNGLKHGCFVKLNGLAKSILKPSIPTLRSRGIKGILSCDSPRKKSRSSRTDKHEAINGTAPKYRLDETESAKDCCCLNNNNNNNNKHAVSPVVRPADLPRAWGRHQRGRAPSSDGAPAGGCFVPISPDTSRSCTPVQCSRPSSTLSAASTSTSSTAPDDGSAAAACLWDGCGAAPRPTALTDHLRTTHVAAQAGGATVRCLWRGCKVYGRPSRSHAWLDRHVLAHTGDKPFTCIVAACGLRFASQAGLERHVNRHFNGAAGGTTGGRGPAAGTSSRDDTPSKLMKRRKGKRKKTRRAKTNDYFDCRTLEIIQRHLVVLSQLSPDVAGSSTSVAFRSTVIARRTGLNGDASVLLHWFPEHILPDSWAAEREACSHQTVPLASLPAHTATLLHPSFYAPHRFRKHRRK